MQPIATLAYTRVLAALILVSFVGGDLAAASPRLPTPRETAATVPSPSPPVFDAPFGVDVVTPAARGPLLLANPCAERQPPPPSGQHPDAQRPRQVAPPVTPPSTIRQRIDDVLRDHLRGDSQPQYPEQQLAPAPLQLERPTESDDAIRRLGDKLRGGGQSTAPVTIRPLPDDPG